MSTSPATSRSGPAIIGVFEHSNPSVVAGIQAAIARQFTPRANQYRPPRRPR